MNNDNVEKGPSKKRPFHQDEGQAPDISGCKEYRNRKSILGRILTIRTVSPQNWNIWSARSAITGKSTTRGVGRQRRSAGNANNWSAREQLPLPLEYLHYVSLLALFSRALLARRFVDRPGLSIWPCVMLLDLLEIDQGRRERTLWQEVFDPIVC